MKDLLEPIKAYLKKVFSDLHNAVVGAVVAALILSGGGIYLFAQQLWTQLKNIALSPTPLWATVALALLLTGRMFLKKQVTDPLKNSSQLQPTEQKEITRTNANSFGFVENGNLKWKVHLACGSIFRIEDTPYCVKHDLQLLHLGGGYICSHSNEDGCDAHLKDTDHALRKKYVGTLAERQFRKTEKV